MSPADGSFPDALVAPSILVPDLSVILPGGRTLLALSGLDDPLPESGRCGDALWQSVCWPRPQGHVGLALVEAPLLGSGQVQGACGRDCGIAPPRAVDASPASLAEFVRRNGLNMREVFNFLTGSASADLHPDTGDFATRFLSLATELGGVVEILANPDSGGLFAQGWSMSLAPGRQTLARLDGTLRTCDADIAIFLRDDIPAPGGGFCLFTLDWRGIDLDRLDSLFYEQDGALRRLEILRDRVVRLHGEAAADHVRQMLPRLAGDGKAVSTHRRICRPRYPGIDTLSAAALPVAAALDAVFQAPSGALLAAGWLLDPAQRVERVIIKSTAGLYAPVHDRWSRFPRADLQAGFSGDPRFAGLLDDSDNAHGFVAHAPGRPRKEDEDFYLELVLDDAGCLFRPLTVTPLAGREGLPRVLAALPLHDPASDQMVEGTLAPFLRDLATGRRKAPVTPSPLPLSPERGEITAVIPLDRLDHLQPIMALLSGTPEADRLDLVIVMRRSGIAGLTLRLRDLFAFYGLRGCLLPVSDAADLCARIEAGLALATGARVLIWQPSALPSAPGWLRTLETELSAQAVPGLISPILVYEDGSIFYGGEAGSAMLGYPRGWLTGGAAQPRAAGAAQIALIDRDALTTVGGFGGRLYSDALLHQDLAHRLHEGGFGTWSSGRVDFWMLDDLPAADGLAPLLERIDSALLAKTGPTDAKDRFS